MENINDYLSFANDSAIIKIFDPDEKLVFSSKIHKFNPFGWKQERNILITTKCIYNLKKKSVKRKINLSNIAAITASANPDSNEFILHIPCEYDYLYTSEK